MKKKLLRALAVTLVILCMLPMSAVAADIGVYEGGAAVNHVELDEGESTVISFAYGGWLQSFSRMNMNHCVASVSSSSRNGGKVSMQQRGDLTEGSMDLVLNAVSAGDIILSITIQAGYSANPDANLYHLDEVYGQTNTSLSVTVIGEEIVVEPEVRDPIIVEIPESVVLPEIEIVDSDGGIASVGGVDLAGGAEKKLAVALSTETWTRATKTINGREALTGFFCPDGGGGYYFATGNEAVEWSLFGDSDIRLSTSETTDGRVATISNISGETGHIGRVTAMIEVARYAKVDDILVYAEDIEISASARVMGVEGAEKLENPFEGIEVEKVPNPFADVTKDDWYYDYYMRFYAAGMLHGVDISPNQDGSQVIFMEKTTQTGREEDVSMLILTEEEWTKRESLKRTSNAEGARIVKLADAMGAMLQQLAATNVTSNADAYNSRGNTVRSLYTLGSKYIPAASYSNQPSPFADVQPPMACLQAVLWANEKGIVKGYGNGYFGRADCITREQMCTILVRCAQKLGKSLPVVKEAKNFPDSGRIQAYARDAVQICQQAGIFAGDADTGLFRPGDYIKGGELAKVITEFWSVLK